MEIPDNYWKDAITRKSLPFFVVFGDLFALAGLARFAQPLGYIGPN